MLKAIGLLVMLMVWSVGASSQSVTDDRWRVVHLTRAPQRIVSLLPSLTEMVCQLGQCARLVGVDRYSNWPDSVTKLPKVGGGLDPNIEAIVALKPDLVLASPSSRITDRLQALGVTAVAMESNTHADVKRILERLGVLLGVPQAQNIWLGIDRGVSEVASNLPVSVRQTKVYIEVGPGPYGAGEQSFIGETLKRLGAGNILPASMGAFPKVNPEFVVQANPDVIMIGEQYLREVAQRPGWRAIRAVREGRVCAFNPRESDVLVRPGPRMAEAAQLMAQCLQKMAPAGQGKPS